MHKNDKSFLETYKKTKVKTKQNKQNQKSQVNISGGSSCLQRPQIKSLTDLSKERAIDTEQTPLNEGTSRAENNIPKMPSKA